MATVFGWKRKVGKPSRKRAAAFDESEQQDDQGNDVPFELDWRVLVPKAKGVMLEDIQSKSHRLRDEGVALAEQERLDQICDSFKISCYISSRLRGIASHIFCACLGQSTFSGILCINSSCYHPPPRADPRDLYFFFRGTTNSPPPGHQKLQIPRPWGTETQQKLLT